jgi:hypothetical protein
MLLGALVWPAAVVVALAAAIGTATWLPALAGLLAAIAGTSGWRAAPIGLMLTSLVLLVPEVIERIGLLELRNGIATAALGLSPELHPVGLLVAATAGGMLLITLRRAEGRRLRG